MVTTRSLVGAASVVACGDCAAPLAWDQRYCVECGARRGGLPAAFSAMLGGALGAAPSADDAPDAPELPRWLAGLVLPSPRVAAAATLCVLAFGVAVGRAATPPPRAEGMSAAVAAALPSILGLGRTAAPAAAPIPARAPVVSVPAPAPTPTPTVAPAATPGPAKPVKAAPKPAPAPVTPAAPVLPTVNHVFVIVLTDHGVDAAFGPGAAGSYLSTTLRQQGELLPNYYAVAQGELANEVALISGQGPTPETAGDCPQFVDLLPGTVGAQGQAAGSGCVYPTAVKTVADELGAGNQVWKAYVEDIGSGVGAGQPATCRQPGLGGSDPSPAAAAGDAYVTWRDPFVYFHSLIDVPACAADVVGLDQLAPDLTAAAAKAPTLAYIVPNACHDGAEAPCAPGQPAGLAGADAWLRTVVPEIMSSAAYKDGGLIAITFDQAPQTGPGADSSACCLTPTTYPNLAPGAAGPPATTPTQAGAPVSTTPTTAAPPQAGAPVSTAPTTAAPPPYALPVPSTPATGVTTTAGTPAGRSTFVAPASATATGGGGRVGLLLVSPFVKAGSINPTAYNHYSLLASVQDLFQLPNIGYAGISGLPVFDATVYNGKP